jgi:DNA invertase Pin-like site-specific DNA recombinase
VSTADQAAEDRGGLPRQREIVQRTIAQRGLNCIRDFEVSNVSGTNVRNCPEVQEILRMVGEREIQGVVIADLDRLLRAEKVEDSQLLQVFQDTGAILYSGGADLNFSSPDGRLTGLIRVALTGFELDLFKERIRGSKEAKRRAGKCPSSAITLPRGVSYDRKKEMFYYDARISEVVEAFRLIDEEGISNIALVASKTGIEARTLHNLLRNEIYTGHRVYKEKRGPEKYAGKNGQQSDRRKVARSEAERIEVQVIPKPAVPRDRFERVQRVLNEKRNRWKQQRAHDASVNLGVGVAKCDYCGEPLYCSSGRRKNRKARGYYMCKRNYYVYRRRTGGCEMRNIFKDDLHATIRKFTAEHLASESVLTSIIDHALRSHGARLDRMAPLGEAKLHTKDLRRREKRLIDLYEAGHIEIDELVARKAALRRRKPASAIDCPDCSAMTASDVQQVARLIVRGALAFARLDDPIQQKAIVDQLFSEIRFRDDMIVRFRLRPQFAQTGTLRLPSDDAQSGRHTGTGSSRRRA